MASLSARFKRFIHPCMRLECRARNGQISYGLSKERPTILEKSVAICPRCGAGHLLRLGPPEASGVRIHIKLLPLSIH